MNTYAIIGAGKFGSSLALNLQQLGKSVVVVDINKKALEPLEPFVEKIFCCDAKNADVLHKLGISDVECAIVATSGNVEESALITMTLKEVGVPEVVSKAKSETHAKLLKQIGADKIVFPEKDMGIRIARLMAMGNVRDYIELSGSSSIVEVECPEKWAGRSLKEINARAAHGVSVIAIIRDGKADVNIDPLIPLKKEMVLAIIGEDEKIRKIL